MKRLQLLLPLPARLDQTLAIARHAAPSLLKLLKRGQSATHEASLAGTLCRAFGIKQQQDWPLAPVGAMQDGLNAADGYWLRLDPVHLEVGMGGLLLHPSENLQLSQTEAQDLIADINLHWQREGLKIQAAHPTRWYVKLDDTPNLRTTPLDQMAGEYLTPGLPRGADARQFLKLINEVQMLMHSHPVNLARENEGRLAVNGLWLWGGGTLPASKTRLDRIAGDHFDLQALAHLAGRSAGTQPKTLSNLHGSERALVALTAPDKNWDGDLETYLAQLEENWFHPLLRQLVWGRIREVRLNLIGQQSVTLTPAQAWRIWR